VAADPNRLTPESRDLRLPGLGLIAVVALGNAWALVRLIDLLVNGGGNCRDVLGAAAGVWITNLVVFALAYWETDRGGPLGRARPEAGCRGRRAAAAGDVQRTGQQPAGPLPRHRRRHRRGPGHVDHAGRADRGVPVRRLDGPPAEGARQGAAVEGRAAAPERG